MLGDISAMAIALPVNQSVATTAPAPAFRINQTGSGPNGIFQISNTSNTQPALQGLTNGRGRAGFFRITNTGNTQPALQAQTNGSGFAVSGLSTGTGGGGFFQVNNTGITKPALEVRSNGSGDASAIYMAQSGTGYGATFDITNTSSDRWAILGRTNSTVGAVARFEANNENSIGDAVQILTRGSSATGLRVVATGNARAGDFYSLQTAQPVLRVTKELGSGYALTVNTVGTQNAAHFTGNVHVEGTLTKTAGSFRIDHPLDPEHKYLSHSFVESPDMMNVYNGNVTLDENGRATVDLPDYFEALNKDFRYQLTAIGSPGPNLYIAEGVKQNRFRIAGGRLYARVSWQVTGVRKDAYAEQHRIKVEEEKPRAEKDLVARR